MKKNKNSYVTGTGQKLVNIHSKDKCDGRPCVIHNPSDHCMRDFPTHWREDRGIMERICMHSVGHPDPDSPWGNGSYEWIHGCDGCCVGEYGSG